MPDPESTSPAKAASHANDAHGRPSGPSTARSVPLPIWERRWIRGYVWTGVLAAMLVTMPTSLAEIALIPPALFFLPLANRSFPLWKRTGTRPAFLALLAFYAWIALGLLWSPDRSLGREELGTARFFLPAILLTPALRITTTGRRHVLVALCVGFLIGNAVQLLNAWAIHGGGPDALKFGRLPERISGWWDPAGAGTILTAAIGIHLPVALMGSGKKRVAGIMGVFATAGGLAMTGSRGGWAASVLLVMGAGLFALVRAGVREENRTGTALAFMSLIASFLVVGFALRGPIADRLDKAQTQVSAAMEGDVTSDTGARIAMKQDAIAAFAEHPVTGVGTGGFSAYSERRHADDEQPIAHDHAHDTLLHTAASNGLVGVAFLLAAFVLAIIDAVRHARTRGFGTLHAGPLFALAGLALTTPFDTLHVSASAAAVTGMIFALCLAPPKRDPHEPIDIIADDAIRNATRG